MVVYKFGELIVKLLLVESFTQNIHKFLQFTETNNKFKLLIVKFT